VLISEAVQNFIGCPATVNRQNTATSLRDHRENGFEDFRLNSGVLSEARRAVQTHFPDISHSLEQVFEQGQLRGTFVRQLWMKAQRCADALAADGQLR
jgi:hypothetical protein